MPSTVDICSYIGQYWRREQDEEGGEGGGREGRGEERERSVGVREGSGDGIKEEKNRK